MLRNLADERPGSGVSESGTIEGMTDPVDTPKRLYRKAARGKDESAPLIVLSGVALVLTIVVSALTAAVLLVYFLV
jgi:hypothetical protein